MAELERYRDRALLYMEKLPSVTHVVSQDKVLTFF
jgi:hypothetical protein